MVYNLMGGYFTFGEFLQ